MKNEKRMMTKMAVQKGLSAIKEAMNNSTQMLKIKPGESALVRILTPADEILSVWEYTIQINGQWQTITALPKGEDPLAEAGYKPSFKSYLAVYDYADGKVKILKASKSVGIQILGLVEEYGDLTKRDFKISRQGEKLATTYQFFARDPKPFEHQVELPNIEGLIESQTFTREAILNMMNGIGKVEDNTPKATEGDTNREDDDFPF